MGMIDRIHKQSQDYKMKKVPGNLAQLLGDTVDSLRPRLEANKTQLSLRLSLVPFAPLDRLHLQDMFRNLLNSSQLRAGPIISAWAYLIATWWRRSIKAVSRF
jgi:hypothetical protein